MVPKRLGTAALGNKKTKRCVFDQGASREEMSNGQIQHIKVDSTRFIEGLDIGCEKEESEDPKMIINTDLKNKQLY